MNRFVRFAAVSAVSLVAIGSATAADMPLKAPPAPAPAPVLWTGFYGGFNIGGGWTHGGNAESCSVLGGGSVGCAIVPDSGLNASGVIGGAQFGYNRQFGAWVAGVETDIQGSGIRGSRSVSGTFPDVGGGFSPPGTLSTSQSIAWFGTLRGRIGILATDTMLVYATGGLIYGDVKTSQNLAFATVAFPATSDGVHAGGIVGGGVEWAFAPRWSAKAEAMYFDLGSVTTAAVQVPPASVFTDFKTFGFHGAIARVGINYHLW